MKYSLLLVALLSSTALLAQDAQIKNNVKEINALNTQVSNIDTQVNSIDSQVMGIDTKVTSVEKKIASMESKIDSMNEVEEPTLAQNKTMLISVTGQGVAPMNTSSPAQAYALAKRAATADAYRLIAEKVKGVRIDGQDLIKNMMVKRSTVRTSVNAMVRNANVVETTFKEGLCEVDMEIVISHAQFAR